MKEELYLWIRNLAVFYIFFTAVLNLIPDQKYEKYVRFFMGLLLIFMMSTPIFSILGKGSELTESFLDNFLKKQRERTPGISEYSESLSGKRLRTGTGTENPGNSGKKRHRSI